MNRRRRGALIGAAIGTAYGLYSASQELSVEWGVPQEQIRVGIYVLVLEPISNRISNAPFGVAG